MLTLCMSYFSCFVSGASCHFFSIPFWVVYFSLCTSQGEELSQDTAATPIKDQIAPCSGFPHSRFILTVFLHSGLLGTEATLERFLLITRTWDGLSPVPLGEKCKAHTEQGWVKCRPVIRSGTQPHKKHWRILLCSFLCVSSSSVSLQIPLWTTSSFCMASSRSRSTLTCDACSLSSSSL